MNAPVCRACGSLRNRLRGTRRGRSRPTEFSFHDCADCGLLFVEPFAGFELYDDAYYRGQGPDPFVDYETEYRDWRATDRRLELADLHRVKLHGTRLMEVDTVDLTPESDLELRQQTA
jgi:hypothetical protein